MLSFWKKMNLWYERLVLLILVFILLISAWCVYDSWYVYRHTMDKNILRYKPGAVTATANDPPLTEDMAAWLTIDGTAIDYPVMQYSDNIKYLNTDPFGNYSLGGSIFLDSRCCGDFTDDYSLIYGHHMEYGKMFGALDDFLNESFFLSHRSGTLLVGKNGEKKYYLNFFAALQADATEEAVFDPGREEIRQYIRSNASIFTENPQGRIVGLSTCTGADSMTRTVVFAFLTEQKGM